MPYLIYCADFKTIRHWADVWAFHPKGHLPVFVLPNTVKNRDSPSMFACGALCA